MTDDSPDAAGSTPKKARPTRKSFLLRLSPELMTELRRWSEHELRSLNGHIEYLLREALKRRGRSAADTDPGEETDE